MTERSFWAWAPGTAACGCSPGYSAASRMHLSPTSSRRFCRGNSALATLASSNGSNACSPPGQGWPGQWHCRNHSRVGERRESRVLPPSGFQKVIPRAVSFPAEVAFFWRQRGGFLGPATWRLCPHRASGSGQRLWMSMAGSSSISPWKMSSGSFSTGCWQFRPGLSATCRGSGALHVRRSNPQHRAHSSRHLAACRHCRPPAPCGRD